MKKLMSMGILNPKTLDVVVTSRLGTLRLQLPKSSTGKDVLDRIVTVLGLREYWYFGLSYMNKIGVYNWLDVRKKLVSYDLYSGQTVVLRYTVKYYPENIDKVLLAITKRLLYLHMRDMIHSDLVYVPLEVAIVLASHAAQEQYGDLTPALHTPGLLLNSGLLPQSLLKQYNMSEVNIEKLVYQQYAQRCGMSRQAAISIYLKICQSLHMYGVRHSPVTNTRGSPLFMAIDSFGVKLYSPDNLLLPKTAFNLAEIRAVEFKRNNLAFSVGGQDEPCQFVVFTKDINQARRLFLRCLGYRDLYIRGISEEPSLLSYIVGGAGKDPFSDVSLAGRSMDEVAREAAELEVGLNKRLKGYDAGFWQARHEYYQSQRETEAIEREMKSRSTRKEEAIAKHTKTVRAKGFYDFHTSVSHVTVPSVAREHHSLTAASRKLSAAVASTIQAAEHCQQVCEESRHKTNCLRSAVEADFMVIGALLPFDDGIAEEDGTIARSAEFPVITQEHWRQPWSNMRSYIKYDAPTLNEIARLEQELVSELGQQVAVDRLYRSLLEEDCQVWDKYDHARQLLMHDVTDRVRILDKL